MTPERFRQVRDVADAALDRPETERAAFLTAACAGNETLRADVDSLLAAYEDVRGQSFLETPAAEMAIGAPLNATEEDARDGALPPGTRLGAYELGAAVGRGGMGIVYRAVRADDEYRQVVAIKVIRRGMDTAVGQRRFREERQILAGLDHPGIARLLDGGTTEHGLPYFVMEYVEGEPIDAYCDRRRLGVAARLRLFLRVCQAVHHAHRSLVVHRDLKPGNVLVTADGAPKLLDFGIARLVRPAGEPGVADPTVTALRMMTPDYASPEQVRGEPVTTATDVYSLGVLLYELLSGQRPHPAGLPHEVFAAICNEDPERPSSRVLRTRPSTTAEAPALLRKRLAGDLDTIVLKALRKAPDDRYASAEAFADDIARHVEGRPVRARPQTLAYRAGKFARRNPAALAAAALALATLVAGIVTTTRQARIAEANRARAQKRFDDVRQLANALLFGIHDAVKELPGSTPARELIVSHALRYLDTLSREVGADRELERELAAAYERVGDVQGRPSFPNLGDTRGALASYAKALHIRKDLSARSPEDADSRRDLATTHLRIGAAQNVIGSASEALASYEQALDILSGLPGGGGGRDLVVAQIRVGDGLARVGRHQEALARYRAAVAGAEALAASAPGASSQRILGTSLQKLGDALALAGDPGSALAIFRRIQAIDQVALAASPDNAQVRRDVATSHYEIGRMLLALGQADAAIEEERTAVAGMEALARADPKNAWAQADVSEVTATLGDALAAAGRPREALDAYRRAAAIDEARARADPANQEALADRADRHARLGDLLLAAGETKKAREYYRGAVPTAEALVAADPKNAEHQLLLARLHEGLERCSR